MKTNSERGVEGAEYNSSFPNSPPQCHPGMHTHGEDHYVVSQQRARGGASVVERPRWCWEISSNSGRAGSLTEPNSVGATLFFLRFHGRKDYLTDRARSKDFYIDYGESVDDITRCISKLYLKRLLDTDWAQYTSRLSTVTESRSYTQLRAGGNFE